MDDDPSARASGEEELRRRIGAADPRVFVWSLRIPYYYTAFNRFLSHAGYVSLMEASADRFLARIGCAVGTTLRDRGWIPVVQEHALEISAPAEVEERLVVAWHLTELVARRLFRAALTFFALRDARADRVATARITHGYVLVRGKDEGWVSHLVEWDRETTARFAAWTIAS
jgi:acyl-CoA thioesterase FadM